MLPNYLSTLMIALSKQFAPFSRSNLLRLVRSPLYINSFYLLGGPVVSAGFGFLFWTLAARTTTAADIGITTAAIASASLLISLCDLGLGTAVVYFAVHRRHQATELLNLAISLGWMLSAGASLLFLLGIPLWAAGLSPMRQDSVLAVVFVLFTCINYLLTLHDAVMLSQRRAHFVFWRNLACNVPSVFILPALLLLIDLHRALLIAYALPNILVGLFISLVIMPRAFPGYRFFGRFDRTQLSGVVSYSLATYSANLLWGCTTFALPIIAINTLSPASTGYFYICWTLVNLILIIPRAVVSALFVEGAHARQHIRQKALQSLLLIFALSLPLGLGLWFWGGWLLALFGKSYVNMPLLQLLLLSIVPFSVNSIFLMSLRVQKQLAQVNLFSAVVAAAVLSLSALLALRIGVYGLAWGWLLGHGLAAVAAIGAVARKSFDHHRIRSTI